MKPVLRAMFLSPAFREPTNRGALIKSPVDLVVGSVHLLGLPCRRRPQLVRMLQGLARCRSPAQRQGLGWRREVGSRPTRCCCASSTCAA
jgi:hypothetical protein